MRDFSISALLIYIFSTVTVVACEDADIALNMREAIYVGDAHSVEREFATHQTAFEAGKLTADEMRCLFRHFARSRVETLTFIGDWMELYPSSPFAQTAMAWNLYQASWDMRGDDRSSRTYSEALHTFGRWQREAWQLASQAYAHNSRLIPASDFLISSANQNGASAYSQNVFKDVMASDPNFGTYKRARGQHIPGWGRPWHEAVKFCDTYAPEFEDDETDPVMVCKLKASHGYSEMHRWRIDTLKSLNRTDLDHLWLWYLTRPDASAEEAARAYAAINRSDNYDDTYAVRFDERLAQKYEFPFLTNDVRKRRVAYAKDKLPHDPHNPKLIKWLINPLLKPEVMENGRVSWTNIPQVEPKEEVDLAKRQLARTPFSPEAWSDYEIALYHLNDIIPHHEAMAIRRNMVVYSNHQIAELEAYILHLVSAYGDYPLYTGEREIPVEAKGYEHLFAIYYADVEKDRDIICPFMRAVRLHDQLCELGRDRDCSLPPYASNTFAVIEIDAKNRGICTVEQTMPAEALWFSPATLPIGD